jgi:aromatic ring hydroxylase
MVTTPSEKVRRRPEVNGTIEKDLTGRAEILTEDRIRILRLMER